MKQAKWIWQNNKNNNDEYVYFIDEFNAEKSENIILYISCDTDYTVYINGILAGFGQYADYSYYKVYDSIDISKFIKKGVNRIAVCGYYQGGSFSTHFCGNAGLIYEIFQGSNVLAFSSENTKCKLATDYISYKEIKITNQLGFTYSYNMEKYDSWNMPDYEYNNFLHSVVINNQTKELNGRPVKKLVIDKPLKSKLIKAGSYTYNGGTAEAEKQQKAIIVYDAKIKGKKISASRKGIYALYDLEYEEAGFLYLKITVKEKTEIGIGYGEHIIDGRVRTFIEGRNFAVSYTAKAGSQEYLNTFVRFAGRYLQVFADTDQIEIESVSLCPVYYPLTQIEFKAETKLRQKIYEISVRTLRLCLHEHYEDCPWREQSLYALDSRNQMLCGYYAFNETEAARASLKLIGLDNRSDNLLSICCPSRLNLTIPSFSLYYIIQMYEYMHYTKDVSLCLELFDKMERILNVFINRISQGLVPIFDGSKEYWNFYEWADNLEGNLFGIDEYGFDLILNSLFSLALDYMIKICEETGRKENITLYLKIKTNINKEINNNFYDSESEMYFMRKDNKTFSELGNSLAILCGAAKGDKAKHITEKMADENNNMTKVTLSMLCFKYDAMIKADKEKYRDYILSDIDKDYGYMLENGATSFWETIKGESDFNGAGSLCHGWSAMPVYYYNILKGSYNI